MAKDVASPVQRLIRRVVEDPRFRDLPDHDLLRQFVAQRDEAAFLALLRRHGPMVLDVCCSMLGEADAEDAFQATFLLLVQKAGLIRKRASVGSWLHGVAYHTALKSRSGSAAREKHEARAPERQLSDADDLSWRELRQVLHEELGSLPEQFREPLVLCYLEGTTQQRAAARLGLAERTLRDRLERGRELLRERLARRGLGPAVLLVAAALSGGASACVPTALVSSTVYAATAVASVAVVPARVAVLTEGVVKAMFLTKLKTTTLAALLLVAVGAGLAGRPSLATQPPEPARKADERKPANQPKGKAATWQEREPLKGRAPVAVAFSPDGKKLATAEWGSKRTKVHVQGEVAIWDLRTGLKADTLTGHESGLNGVAFTPDGKSLVTAGVHGAVKVWELAAKQERGTVQAHKEPIHALAMDAEGTILATASEDTTAKLWDLKTLKEKATLKGHTQTVSAVAVSPDGKLVATGGEDESLRLWDAQTGKELAALAGHTGDVSAVAFSPDGGLLVSGGDDATVRVWDMKTRKELKRLDGHTLSVRAVAFSPDGKTVASAGSERKKDAAVVTVVKLWDVTTGKERTTLRAKGYESNAIAFSRDGKTLAVGGTTMPDARMDLGAVLVWELK